MRAATRALALMLASCSAIAAVSGCTGRAASWRPPGASAGASAAAGASGAGGGEGSPGGAQSPPARSAPAQTFGVGIRTIALGRSAGRPLPTTVWYPAKGATTAVGTARGNAPVAQGSYPLVLFSHGLTGLPANYAAITTRLAAAGFVVAAPAYPHTSADATDPNVTDLINQPADGFYVVNAVLALGKQSGDSFYEHIDQDGFAVAGHSAGGFTTAGMLAAKHDARLRAAVIIAGGTMGTYTAPSASVLFVHGDNDASVAYSTGQSAYTRLSWPKAFLTVVGGDHSDYLLATGAGFEPTVKTITDFLRATLYGDPAAKPRLTADGTSATTRYEQHLG